MVLCGCLWQFVSYKIAYYFQIWPNIAIKKSSGELFTTRRSPTAIFHNASNNKLLLQPPTLYDSKHNGHPLNNKSLKTLFKPKLLTLRCGPSPFMSFFLTFRIDKSSQKQSVKTILGHMAGCVCFL